MNDAPLLVEARSLSKHYDAGLVTALDGASLDVRRGEAVALEGPSGCGKSTLLRIIGALERPTSGEVRVDGRSLAEHAPLHAFRARMVGFVFQMHHLLPQLSLAENVEIPLLALGMARRERRERTHGLLAELGLAHRAAFTPARVSGGERQRAAIARALAAGPPLLLCDEPTGSLDSRTGGMILELLFSLRDEKGVTLLVATHDREVSRLADRVARMRDGRMADPEA